MKTAIIIVNYNDLKDTIKYVKKVSEYKTIDRIVVVDNLSTEPNTLEKLKELENDKTVVISSEKNGGYSYGNNSGVNYLINNKEEYDYLIISNPDIEVDENAIYKCIDVLENNEKIAISAPRMLNSDKNPIRRSSWKIRTFGLDLIHSTRFLELLFYKKLRGGEYSKEDYEKEILEVEAISGSFFIIKSDVFKEIGLFDENVFLFYEEDILASKLKSKGYKTVSVNNVSFVHYESQTIDKIFSYYKKMNQLYKSKMYYQKTYNKINFLQVLIFKILKICRNIELIIEIPIRKIFKR